VCEDIEGNAVQLNPFPFQRGEKLCLAHAPMRTARGSLSTAWCMDERAPPRRAILNAWPNFRYWPKTILRPISIHRARRTYSTLAPALNGSFPFEVSLRKVKPLSVGSIVMRLRNRSAPLPRSEWKCHLPPC
jgi:hypothetical protein